MDNSKNFAQNWLMLFSLMVGGYAFFHPVHPIADYLTTPQRVLLADNYWTFAARIFEPQTLPWAESLLLPLIARLLGATSDLLAFQFLSVFLTLCIMPVFCLMLQKKVKTAKGVALGVVVFAVTFRYLYDHILGSPDPLTILLILLASASRNRTLAAYVFLAGLSHFSLTLVAMLAMYPLFAITSAPREPFLKQAKPIVMALVLSKIFLIGWYWLFDYQLFSRLDFIMDKGLGHFWRLFADNPLAFLYTPGRIFGLVSVLVSAYLLFKRRYVVVLAYCFALAVTYAVLFITLDGLRIFSVVIVGAYFCFLVQWLNCLFPVESESCHGAQLSSKRPA